MNIIYIHTHDSGRIIQPYGHAVPTPNLMRLALDGVIFRNCFSCAPTCSPSRSALLTGTNPHSAGMLGLAHRGFQLRDPTRHMAAYFSNNGFETVLCGVQHEIQKGKEHVLGYSRMLAGEKPDPNISGASKTMAADLSNAAAAAQYIIQSRGKPYFLSFGMECTHLPLPEPGQDINPNYVQPPPSMPDHPKTRLDMAGYLTLAHTADRCVGIILKALNDSKMDENTLVIFTTDHGIAFPRMKCNLYDDGIGVSLIIQFPKRNHAGTVVDALVSHLDVFPTLCALTDLTPPPWLEGHSFLPLIRGETEKIRETLFAEVTYHAAYEPMRAVRTARYKYIRYFDDYPGVILANIDASRSKQFLLDNNLKTKEHFPNEMLFDLYFDPHEQDNLAENPQYDRIKDNLKARLTQWMAETQDPLLSGPVPLPSGAYADKQDDLEPS
jgi:arylsulfatase A-like enzyme